MVDGLGEWERGSEGEVGCVEGDDVVTGHPHRNRR